MQVHEGIALLLLILLAGLNHGVEGKRIPNILNSSSIEKFKNKSSPSEYFQTSGADYRLKISGTDNWMRAGVLKRGGTYYGARAKINLWNPKVYSGDASRSFIWLASEDFRTTIQAGLTVFPSLYSNSYETRLFTYWDSLTEGCYNLQCQGFVQTSNVYPLDWACKPLSTYGGQQYHMVFNIFKDNKRGGNWFLTINGYELGYWPNKLLPGFASGAKFVHWGGEVRHLNESNRSPEMGSGHFATEGFGKAAFFRNICTLDVNGLPQDHSGFEINADRPECYDLKFDHDDNFYYGGPGGPQCHY